MEKRLKDHNLFKPANLEEGRHEVVGDCNGFTMQQRWDAETPAFARAIIEIAGPNAEILDYGCGVGRLAREILKQKDSVVITGTDASKQMMEQAEIYVANIQFNTCAPQKLDRKFDLAYLVYVLQHVPAIEIREVLTRIHHHLKDDGFFVYCSSDYRMAIRFDGPGFCDDRFLGVNLQDEVERLFEKVGPLFKPEELEGNPILKRMITGKTEGADDGLAHPAFIYKKRRIQGQVFNAILEVKREEKHADLPRESQSVKEEDRTLARMRWDKTNPKKILLLNRLSPGDVLVMTNAIRDLHKAFPRQYLVDVRTPCNEIFDNNPGITKLQYDENLYNKFNNEFASKERWKKHPKDNTEFIDDIMVLDAHYPLIHRSGIVGAHFAEGHREFLEEALGIRIPQTDIRPEIFLSRDEQAWPSPALVKCGVEGKYWVINAGSKDDASLKQYPFYQEVIDQLVPGITFVQVGQKAHNHKPLKGAIDMVGQTNMRELFRLIAKAEGVISCVSLPMHIAAAFSKPCVVVAGAREGTRWELYPNHQFLYVNGCLACAPYDGCWRGKPDDCNNKKDGVPRCMLLIRPGDVAWAVQRYYEGGVLDYEFSAMRPEVAHA
jgi:ADP-heptose:LPS heptosyltransferase/SAM-dependent methyltransferase